MEVTKTFQFGSDKIQSQVSNPHGSGSAVPENTRNPIGYSPAKSDGPERKRTAAELSTTKESKADRFMLSRPNLINMHDNTAEGVIGAMKRQSEADALYSRVEIETLKELGAEQAEEITKLKHARQRSRQ